MNYIITTDQQAPYKNLKSVVQKHIDHAYQRPTPAIQQQIFNDAHQKVCQANRPVILDFGCGTGLSTITLSRQFKDCLVVGVDKSMHRLSKNDIWKMHPVTQYMAAHDNVMLVQADIIDFILLVKAANWTVVRQYYLYPNPWPKSSQFKRRLHGHPIFPTLMQLSPHIEVRSNWPLYLTEFLIAAKQVAPLLKGEVSLLTPATTAISHFERKYWQAQQQTYILKISQHRCD